MLLILASLVLVYVGTFSYWWLTNPIEVHTVNGKNVRTVEFRMTPFRWHTRYLWIPAFWFMQNVRGYESTGLIAAYEESVYFYAK